MSRPRSRPSSSISWKFCGCGCACLRLPYAAHLGGHDPQEERALVALAGMGLRDAHGLAAVGPPSGHRESVRHDAGAGRSRRRSVGCRRFMRSGRRYTVTTVAAEMSASRTSPCTKETRSATPARTAFARDFSTRPASSSMPRPGRRTASPRRSRCARRPSRGPPPRRPGASARAPACDAPPRPGW